MLTLVFACLSEPELTSLSPHQRLRNGEGLDVVLIDMTPMERDLFVLSIVEKQPYKADKLCSKISKGPSLDYCLAYSERPHLWNRIQPTVLGRRQGNGPAAIHDVPNYQKEQLLGVTPSNEICGNAQTEIQCRTARAQASDSDLEAVSECAHLSGAQRHECLFMAAESMFLRNGTQSIGSSIDLCMASMNFSSSCLQHLTDLISEQVPSAHASETDWADFLSNHKMLMNAWQERAPSYRFFADDQLWDRAVHKSFNKSGSVSGNLIDILPPQARVHIRAAAAFRLLHADSSRELNLEDWGRVVLEHLEKRTAGEQSKARPRPAPQQSSFSLKGLGKGQWAGVEPNWSKDNGADSKFPAAHFRKDARRATDPDPLIDAQIAILESAAVLRVGEHLFRDGIRSSSETIRFTAHRLAQQ